MLKGFKEFISRGNVIDLAVAVVIGTAFTAMVTAFTTSVIEPLISRIGVGGDTSYGWLKIPLDSGPDHKVFIDLNTVLSAGINFILVALVVYFLIVVPFKKLKKDDPAVEDESTELTLLTEIRDLLQAGARPARPMAPPPGPGGPGGPRPAGPPQGPRHGQ
ncbi:MAG: large-conductance mechanosensitive channel protein MscL [Mycolicibacterium insubricum]|uniref:large-conductance mechanosensitive channel protein MscL n=1 Tax=Mycolicibacterium insubricum TaxID=444597 RepID=UPI0009F2FC52|nr:large-conductance mechanosensitive channel protein MscL [Mycolicibacterium insubricum]MCB9441926.1 large-conductance mechanosensitive channel protein MscL [Mycolicibacterium sp.]BBZ68546.1 large-conductance mechanosensitive channel [Mycolicibacterium insubricum]